MRAPAARGFDCVQVFSGGNVLLRPFLVLQRMRFWQFVAKVSHLADDDDVDLVRFLLYILAVVHDAKCCCQECQAQRPHLAFEIMLITSTLMLVADEIRNKRHDVLRDRKAWRADI